MFHVRTGKKTCTKNSLNEEEKLLVIMIMMMLRVALSILQYIQANFVYTPITCVSRVNTTELLWPTYPPIESPLKGESTTAIGSTYLIFVLNRDIYSLYLMEVYVCLSFCIGGIRSNLPLDGSYWCGQSKQSRGGLCPNEVLSSSNCSSLHLMVLYLSIFWAFVHGDKRWKGRDKDEWEWRTVICCSRTIQGQATCIKRPFRPHLDPNFWWVKMFLNKNTLVEKGDRVWHIDQVLISKPNLVCFPNCK